MLLGNMEQNARRNHNRKQGRSAIADKRERDARDRHEREVHGNIHEGLDRDPCRQPHRSELGEFI